MANAVHIDSKNVRSWEIKTNEGHFPNNVPTSDMLNVFDAQLLHPLPHIEQLSRQTSQLLQQITRPRRGSLDPSKLAAAYRLVASALMLESLQMSLAHLQVSRLSESTCVFLYALLPMNIDLSIESYANDVFAQQYSRILDASYHAVIRKTYTSLVHSAIEKDCNVAHAGVLSDISALSDIRDASICLTCLAYIPVYALSCGHHFCHACLQRRNSRFEDCYRPPLCIICRKPNNASFIIKPITAGVRVLFLEGKVQDSRCIVQFLSFLRKTLRVPLYRHFDLAIGKGIGIFFILMLFCKEAGVKDCKYHLPQLKYTKISEWEFRFGGSLVFAREELQSNSVWVIESVGGVEP